MNNELMKKKFIFARGRIEWTVTGKFGSVSFWIEKSTRSTCEDYYGGIEYHYNKKSKPLYLDGDSYRYNCMHNNGECWHDVTYLWATKVWIPNILPFGDEYIWEKLKETYIDNMVETVKSQDDTPALGG